MNNTVHFLLRNFIMSTFSFRAECQADVDCFLQESLNSNVKIAVTKTVMDKDGFPDVEIEIESEVQLENLIEVMREVQDGHVMYQTLRQVPLEQNNLQRNYNL